MWGSWHLCVLWLLCAGIEAQNRSRNRIQHNTSEVQSKRRLPFKSWNSQMYPVWKGSESQKRDCWKGGQVTFNLQNDAPTLTGAKATFFIQLNFPHNQTVLPDGQVVWSQNCTNNSTWVSAGEPVYPEESVEGAECTFPDGRQFPRDSEKRRSKFVYVWQAWGKYWQVVDGPSSNLTVETDGVPLGSYTMEVVVYHYRGRQKFIPIGSTSSQFSITDQIPVSVSISQVLDLDQEDKRFIQNRAVSFSVAVHDPSSYLQTSDVSFSWDFGDESGTLITRNMGVTHTYVSPGVFKAKVVVQAAIPITPCGSAAPLVTTAQGDLTTDVPAEPTTEAATTNGGQQTVVPSGTAVPVPPNSTLLLDVQENLTETEASINEVNLGSASVAPEIAQPTIPTADPEEGATQVAVVNEDAATEALPAADTLPATQEAIPGDAALTATQEAIPGDAALPATQEAIPDDAALPATQEVVPSDAALPATQEVVPSDAALPATQEVVPSDAAAVPAEELPSQAVETGTQLAEDNAESVVAVTESGESSSTLAPAEVTDLAESTAAEPVTEANGEVLQLVKRQAPEGPLVGCLLYRYGTFASDLEIVSGIESVQIVQVEPIAVAGMENAVDLTVTCQGSIPRQVCTVISGPDCENPQETVCNPVEPSSDCQLVLRQIFNDTGVYCVNVSLTDDVSLAVASAQVSVSGAASSVSGIAVTVGVLLVALAVATVAYTYRHLKSYTPLRTEHSSVKWFPDRQSLRLFIQNALGHSRSGESSPLLNGRVV
ncbi:melanocyte protein PMEL [Hyla sarda]|uniref:melanocyte protein PMEL n=1 Tax=Hyla sarda TaxID=327740 RepID=UPI0024C38F7C|nr:melanocyte protein PMEL [Hyla sarda]XP_056418320.1 melanocyte protein PMEL [Hyla sarda]XP_056418321.1 melanocyte protein PMEL [Hyla sarda]